METRGPSKSPPPRSRSRCSRSLVVVALVLLVAAGAAAFYPQREPSPSQLAVRVGTIYGDPHPRVVRLTRTTSDDSTHRPMYIAAIDGDFHKGNLQAQHLTYSALADGSQIWAVRASDDANDTLWLDPELP